MLLTLCQLLVELLNLFLSLIIDHRSGEIVRCAQKLPLKVLVVLLERRNQTVLKGPSKNSTLSERHLEN